MLVDSSAALGVVARKGAGRLRHVRVGQLWVQEKRENEELRFRKVKGTDNPADALTKALASTLMQRYLPWVGMQARTGRASSSLEVLHSLCNAFGQSPDIGTGVTKEYASDYQQGADVDVNLGRSGFGNHDRRRSVTCDTSTYP